MTTDATYGTQSPDSLSRAESLGSAAGTIAMGLFLATMSVTAGSVDLVQQVSVDHSDASLRAVQEVLSITSRDLAAALVDLRSRLEERSEPIEPAVKAVLYSNLWDLYQT